MNNKQTPNTKTHILELLAEIQKATFKDGEFGSEQEKTEWLIKQFEAILDGLRRR